MKLHKIIASCAGIGLIKGGGTIAAMITCLLWWLAWQLKINNQWMIIATAVIILTGIWSATVVDKDWGKDSSKVVIDEAAGMAITLLAVKTSLAMMIVALVLFRFFDIVKPLFIRRMEQLPKGWGVMADDILAGIYSCIVIQLIFLIMAWQHL